MRCLIDYRWVSLIWIGWSLSRSVMDSWMWPTWPSSKCLVSSSIYCQVATLSYTSSASSVRAMICLKSLNSLAQMNRKWMKSSSWCLSCKILRKSLHYILLWKRKIISRWTPCSNIWEVTTLIIILALLSPFCQSLSRTKFLRHAIIWIRAYRRLIKSKILRKEISTRITKVLEKVRFGFQRKICMRRTYINL